MSGRARQLQEEGRGGMGGMGGGRGVRIRNWIELNTGFLIYHICHSRRGHHRLSRYDEYRTGGTPGTCIRVNFYLFIYNLHCLLCFQLSTGIAAFPQPWLLPLLTFDLMNVSRIVFGSGTIVNCEYTTSRDIESVGGCWDHLREQKKHKIMQKKRMMMTRMITMRRNRKMKVERSESGNERGYQCYCICKLAFYILWLSTLWTIQSSCSIVGGLYRARVQLWGAFVVCASFPPARPKNLLFCNWKRKK